MQDTKNAIDNQVEATPVKKYIYDIEKYRITKTTQIEKIEPVILIADSFFAVKGDISFVTGQAKAGKTSIVPYMLATALMKEIPNDLDTLQIKSKYCHNKPILYIDTEQNTASTKRIIETTLDILGKDDADNLYITNIRTISIAEKKEAVKQFIYQIFEKHKESPHFIILDGFADLILDPNNAKESFELIDEFLQLSERLKTAIILYLHYNPNSEKMRGNLGSQSERKCNATIAIKKKDGVHYIEPKAFRYSGDFEPVLFKFDRDLERMQSVTGTEAEKAKQSISKDNEKFEALKKLALDCGLEKKPLMYKELIEKIKQVSKVSDKTADNRRKEMLEREIIYQSDLTKYHINPVVVHGTLF